MYYSNIRPKITSDRTLIILHVIAILLHILSGIFGIYNIQEGNPRVDVIAPLFEYLEDPGVDESFFMPKPKAIFSVPILTPMVCVEFITAGFHIIYLLAILYPGVDRFIRDWIINSPSKNPLRWIEYGITATIMSSFENLGLGMQDFYFFIRNVSCGIALQGLGYLLEWVGDEYKKSKGGRDEKSRVFLIKLYRGLYYFQGLLNNLPFVGIVLYQTFGSETRGAFRLFLENCIPLGFWFNTFGVICQMNFYGWRQFAGKEFTEKWYILLSLSTKMAIFWTSFATFKKIIEDNGNVALSGLDWNVIRYCALSVPAIVVGCFAWLDYWSWEPMMVYEDGSDYKGKSKKNYTGELRLLPTISEN